jgi:hypothetical protein
VFSDDEPNGEAGPAEPPPTQDMDGPRSQARTGLAPGVTLAGRYRIVRLLGRGAMGSVYEAIDAVRSGLRVAVKLLDVSAPQALYRLKNEFRALAETVHPNLVGLHRLAADAHGWFVVMDLIDPSSDFQRYVRGEGALDEGRLRSALLQVVRGIAAIHAADKVHRDLKPSNVLVTREGRVVIVDFGLIGEQEEGGVGRTFEGLFAGTPGYAAPEQARGRVGPAVDLYALGVLLFEALTGRLPMVDDSVQRLLERKQHEDAPDPRALAAGAPEDLCALCVALLRRDPAARPDAGQVLAQLERGPLVPMAMTSLPFVGREPELALLREAALCAGSGAPVLALVSGASGIGKSALTTRFLELMRVEPRAVLLRGRCHAQEQVPYNAFDMLIDALGRYLTKLPPVEAASLMPRDAGLVARVFPTLARVPAVLHMPPIAGQGQDTPLLRRRAFAALKELLARIADRELLIMCFDDLQWADDDSMDLLRELLRGAEAPAALFVCAFRSGQLEEGTLAALRKATSSGCVELQLEPLSTTASAELARAMLEGGGPHEAELRLVVGESAGNPFLIKELARGARVRGRVGDLRETVAAIGAELEADARALLELVCVAGRPLELAAAMRAARVGPQALPGALASSLLRTGTRAGRECIESSHDRIGEAVLEAIDGSRRAEHHAHLAQEQAADPQHDPELVARHYRAAGLVAQAAPFTLQAAERARAALAFSRAAELYEVALAETAEGERDALELALADTYANAGRIGDAAERYDGVSRRCSEPAERRELAAKAMLLYSLAGYVDRAVRFVDALSRELGIRPLSQSRFLALLLQAWLLLRYLLGPRLSSLPIPDETEGAPLSRERLAFCLRASRGFALASPERGHYYGLRSLLIARNCPDRGNWPLVLAGEALLHGIQRGVSHQTEQRALSRAITLAEEHGDPDVLPLVLTAQGAYDTFTGRLQSALEAFERVELAVTTSNRPLIWFLNESRNGRLVTWNLTGQFNEMCRHADAWFAQARALGDTLGATAGSFAAVHRFLALDDPAAAHAAVAEFESEIWQTNLLGADPWVFGEVALYEGDVRAAADACAKARRSVFFATVQRLAAHRSAMWFFQGRVHLMAAFQGGGEDDLRAAERQARHLERERCTFAAPWAAQLRGVVAAMRGDVEQGVAHLTRASELQASCGMLLQAAAARHRIGLLRGGEAGAAQAQEARSTALALGVCNPERWFHTFMAGFRD